MFIRTSDGFSPVDLSFLLQESLSQEPRRVEGKLFFLPTLSLSK